MLLMKRRTWIIKSLGMSFDFSGLGASITQGLVQILVIVLVLLGLLIG